MGSPSMGSLPDRVTVLYDPARPSDAMIDRPVWNWLPWAPIGAVGLFLALVAVKGWLGHRVSLGASASSARLSPFTSSMVFA